MVILLQVGKKKIHNIENLIKCIYANWLPYILENFQAEHCMVSLGEQCDDLPTLN